MSTCTHTNSCLELHCQGDELTDSDSTHGTFKDTRGRGKTHNIHWFFCHLSLMFACEFQAHDTAGRYLFFKIELGIVLKLQNQQYQGSVQEMWFAVLIKLGQKPIDNRNLKHLLKLLLFW